MGTVTEIGTVTVPEMGTQQSPPSGTLLDPSETLSDTHKDFALFWEKYPRESRKGKGAAIKAWVKIKPDSSLSDSILKALQSQINERSRAEPGAFVPHWKNPATWLNQQCWLDAPCEYKAPRGKLSAVERVERATRERQLVREALEGQHVKLIP